MAASQPVRRLQWAGKTTEEILAAVLDEQCEIAAQPDIQAVLEQIRELPGCSAQVPK
jgi:hypothetical protein